MERKRAAAANRRRRAHYLAADDEDPPLGGLSILSPKLGGSGVDDDENSPTARFPSVNDEDSEDDDDNQSNLAKANRVLSDALRQLDALIKRGSSESGERSVMICVFYETTSNRNFLM